MSKSSVSRKMLCWRKKLYNSWKKKKKQKGPFGAANSRSHVPKGDCRKRLKNKKWLMTWHSRRCQMDESSEKAMLRKMLLSNLGVFLGQADCQ